MRSNQVDFRFYSSLNDFWPFFRRQQQFKYLVRDNPAIKDPIEALGIPHPEVELILTNGQAVDFSYSLQEQERFSIYPHFSKSRGLRSESLSHQKLFLS